MGVDSPGRASRSVLRAPKSSCGRAYRKLREVQAVDEVAKDREAFLIDDGLSFVLVSVQPVRLGDDAGRVHHLGGDEDGVL
jgi:hypothetical protein